MNRIYFDSAAFSYLDFSFDYIVLPWVIFETMHALELTIGQVLAHETNMNANAIKKFQYYIAGSRIFK